MKLEGKIDEIIDSLIDGDTYRAIATKYNVSISTLSDYLALPEHSARASSALEGSADQYADKAEEALLNAPSDSVEISRARELAQHYRWKASKRAPKRYGDKLDVAHSGTIDGAHTINITPFGPNTPIATNEAQIEDKKDDRYL